MTPPRVSLTNALHQLSLCWQTYSTRPCNPANSRTNGKNIPKKNPLQRCDELRPISLLCTASKLLEAVAYEQIKDFLISNDIIDSLQSGAKKFHSAHTALIKTIDDIKKNIEDSYITLVISIDFKQAFDRVDRELLCQKMLYYGFSESACQWIRSLLNGRMQSVMGPDGQLSDYLEKTIGVIQGSKLGTPFFQFSSTICQGFSSIVITGCMWTISTCSCAGNFRRWMV